MSTTRPKRFTDFYFLFFLGILPPRTVGIGLKTHRLALPLHSPSPSLFSDLPRSVRQRFFPDRDRTQGPRHPRSRPKLVTTFFLSKVEFLFSTNNRVRGKNSRFFWFRFRYFFPVEGGIYRNRDHSSRSVRSELFLWPTVGMCGDCFVPMPINRTCSNKWPVA